MFRMPLSMGGEIKVKVIHENIRCHKYDPGPCFQGDDDSNNSKIYGAINMIQGPAPR